MGKERKAKERRERERDIYIYIFHVGYIYSTPTSHIQQTDVAKALEALEMKKYQDTRCASAFACRVRMIVREGSLFVPFVGTAVQFIRIYIYNMYMMDLHQFIPFIRACQRYCL